MNALPGIAYVNLSPRLSATDCKSILDAVETQDKLDFAPAWGCNPCPPVLYPDVASVPIGMALILFLPDTGVAGAAGYHTEGDSGRVTGVVAVDSLLDAGWTLTDGSRSVSCCTSHEHFEARKNPFVNVWVDLPDGAQEAFEMCDRVQNQTYKVLGISVSNFLLPPAWDDRAPIGSKFDFMGTLTESFEVGSGGYASRRDATGKPFQVGEMPAEKRNPLGRSARLAK